MRVKSTTYLLLFLAITSCFNYKPKKEQADRIENQIPETAFWIESDNKNGNWLNVEWVHNHKNLTDISIYDADTKKLIEKKRFFLICVNEPDRIEWIDDLKIQLSHYENGLLYFKYSECYLKER